MGILVSQQLFEIAVKYIEVPLKNGKNSVIVIKTKEQEEKYKDKLDADGTPRIKELVTQWLQPNFKETNDLIRESTVMDPFKGERELDYYLYRLLTLEKFIKAWSIKDDSGNAVPCNVENISKLDTVVAVALLEQFNAINTPKDADLKN